MIQVKRVYDTPAKEDGVRILVDRLWPRGVKKERARIDRWERDWAPSDALRKWFKHDPKKWTEFCRRYREEIEESGRIEELRRVAVEARQKTVTLLYGAREERFNNAVALQEMFALFT